MVPRALEYILEAFVLASIALSLVPSAVGSNPTRRTLAGTLGIGIIVFRIAKWRASKWSKNGNKKSVYGLQHGKLHVQVLTPMWMNMGYWSDTSTTKSMAEACRDLLSAVLAEAGFSRKEESTEVQKGERRTKCLIDLGFGCGDQTVYLMGTTPQSSSDEGWWDARNHCVQFDRYIGITEDQAQAQYALERVNNSRSQGNWRLHEDERAYEKADINLFCADAAKPALWSQKLQETIHSARNASQECWVLALDTAYHFSPSRWLLIEHAHSNLDASFIAFDLCLAPTATWVQRLVLRVLVKLMGAPWANFVTTQEYEEKLRQIGYREESIKVVDVSEHVFEPLSRYIKEQDERLQRIGLGIGSFSVAKSMFGWWGRSGVVRGVIVVAKKDNTAKRERP